MNKFPPYGFNPDADEEVHITTQSGEEIYWPKGDMTRLAPAAVCSIIARMLDLRKVLKEENISRELTQKLEWIARPVSFESKFLSEKSIEIHNGIKEIGINEAT